MAVSTLGAGATLAPVPVMLPRLPPMTSLAVVSIASVMDGPGAQLHTPLSGNVIHLWLLTLIHERTLHLRTEGYCIANLLVVPADPLRFSVSPCDHDLLRTPCACRASCAGSRSERYQRSGPAAFRGHGLEDGRLGGEGRRASPQGTQTGKSLGQVYLLAIHVWVATYLLFGDGKILRALTVDG